MATISERYAQRSKPNKGGNYEETVCKTSLTFSLNRVLRLHASNRSRSGCWQWSSFVCFLLELRGLCFLLLRTDYGPKNDGGRSTL